MPDFEVTCRFAELYKKKTRKPKNTNQPKRTNS